MLYFIIPLFLSNIEYGPAYIDKSQITPKRYNRLIRVTFPIFGYFYIC